MAFKHALSENSQVILAAAEHFEIFRPTTLVPLAQNLCLGYESALKQGRQIQWQRLFHYQDMAVSKKASSGPQFWYRGYLTKVTYGKRAQIISVRYESILKKGS